MKTKGREMDSYSKIYQELDGLSFEELNKVLMHQAVMCENQKKRVSILHALRDYKTNQEMIERKNKLKNELLEQREEILKHKWFLSEKVGYDVVFVC